MVVVMLLFLASCDGSKKEFGEAIEDRDSLPVMSTYGVTTFVSDSGIVRYKVIAEEWLMFDRKQPSYWAFEKGIYLEKFDTLFQVEASIKADTAYYFDAEKLWKLMGNVHIRNLKGDMFDTELLYWNQTTGMVYSDQRIRIEQEDRVTFGIGFESNQEMTDPVIYEMEGIYYVNEASMSSPAPPTTAPADSVTVIKTDSIAQ